MVNTDNDLAFDLIIDKFTHILKIKNCIDFAEHTFPIFPFSH